MSVAVVRKGTGWFGALTLALAAWPVAAQVPAPENLPDGDRRALQAEIERLENLLNSAPDQALVTYQIARTWAYGKQWPETIEWLRKVADLRAGFDPGRDSIFAALRATREFQALETGMQAATPPVSHSRAAFVLSEGDLQPESMAYAAAGRRFFFGSMRKGKVMRCSAGGNCEVFATGLGTVLGLKAHGGGLWVLSNSDSESALIDYEVGTGRMVRKYAVGGGHLFNDLAIADSGEVFLTDTRGAAVWRLAKGAAELARLPGRFEGANGIALSPEASLLYVSNFPDGVTVVDLKTSAAAPLARPAGLTLGCIDGLYFHGGSLIAIQNGFMTPRVVKLALDRDLRAVQRFQVLERRNPVFDGVTTGVIVDGGRFFYMANIQDEKQSGFEPIRILKLRL